MKATHLKPYPKETNVFENDFSNMGRLIGMHSRNVKTTNVAATAGDRIMLMQDGFDTDKIKSLQIVNEATGERLLITF